MSINIQQLSFAYKQQAIYQSLDAQIGEAGIYGLFGRNGSGKSTLLKLMSGLLTPSSGSIDILGFTPRKRSPNFLQNIYILPEEFHLPDLSPTVLANTRHQFYPNFRRDLFDAYIARFEVPQDKKFSQMSLGQKKKSAIAFALATLTPVLLMDEPTNGLDIVSRETFKSLMMTEEQAQRMTLISTHQAHDLERIISHIWFIDDGKLMLSSPIKQLANTLRMGVSDSNEQPDNVIYQEPIGAHVAWVAEKTDSSSEHYSELNIEMLYKALSLNKNAVIEAVQNKESNHVS